MTAAWNEFRSETKFWARGSLPAARAAKWATCLHRAWEAAKRAASNLAERARIEARKLIVLTDEQKARIAVMEQAARDCAYLPAHMSMAQEQRRIRARIEAVMMEAA